MPRPAPPPDVQSRNSPGQLALSAWFPPERSCGAGPGRGGPRDPGRGRPGPRAGGLAGHPRGHSHHGVPAGGVSEAGGARPGEAAPVSLVGFLGGEG